MRKEEALEMIPSALDAIEALEREKADWMKGWKERMEATRKDLEFLRKVARGEETLMDASQEAL